APRRRARPAAPLLPRRARRPVLGTPSTMRDAARDAPSRRRSAPRRRTSTTRALRDRSSRLSFAGLEHLPPQRLLRAQDQHADVVASDAERGCDLVVARILVVREHERDSLLV